MKKYYSLLLIAMALILLSGCTSNSLSVEQSKDNFRSYADTLQRISEYYGLELNELSEDTGPQTSYHREFTLTIGRGEIIYVRMINSSFSTATKGKESFLVEYERNIIGNEQDSFDLKLFVEIVNSISGKEISREFCEEFLNAPESKYPAGKYGYSKANGEKIAKILPLTPFEDWTIVYTSDDNYESLCFGGLTRP